MSGNGAHFTPDPSWPSILELATKLWGEPTDKANLKDVRFGKKQSKSVNTVTLVWHDYEAGKGGGYVEIHEAAIGPLPEKPKANGHAKNDGPWNHVDTIYPYVAADGRLILQVIRMLPTWNRKFSQRKPDPTSKSGWRWTIRDLPRETRPLYRLPELLASASTGVTVWITEGEKDCDNLRSLGLVATCPIGGAGKWWAHYPEAFRDRHVVVLPDHDPQAIKDGMPLWHPDGRPVLPGQDHADTVARSLVGIAASVRVLMLPNLPSKGDVSDWLEAGGNRFDLERLAREAPEYVPPAAPPPPNDGGGEVEDEGDGPPEEPPPPEDDPGGAGDAEPLPVIRCVAGELSRMVREAEEALLAADEPVYQRGVLVRPAVVEYDAAPPSGSKVKRKTHAASLVEIKPPAMLRLLDRVANWQKFDRRARGGGAWTDCDPPTKVVEILLASRGEWSFPVIRGILTTPTIRSDGTLLTKPGYDPDSRYYLSFPSNLVLPDIPEAPTKVQALESLARLDALLDGYEFLNKADGVYRAVAQGMLMTQVLRCGMEVSPMQAVSATAPGSGKSHLVDLASTVATGRWCPVMNAGKNDEETEKGINTKLMSGVPGFSIDNVHKTLNLEALNTATERPLLQPRNFGTLTDVLIENGVVIYMTGNNLDVLDEQIRRTMLCKMDVAEEHPEQRAFKVDPIVTVLADRGRYVADVLIITRAYLAHLEAGGEPPAIAPYGSYPDWDRFVRHPLVWLKGVDPLDCQEGMRADDPVKQRRASIIDAWREAFKDKPMTLAEAARFAMTPPVHFAHPNAPQDVKDAEMAVYLAEKAVQEDLLNALRDVFPAGKDGINTVAWSAWMRRFASRKTDGWRFVKDDDPDTSKHHGGSKWRLQKVG